MKRIIPFAILLGGIAILLGSYIVSRQTLSTSTAHTASKRVIISADIEFTDDEESLVQDATLVVLGRTSGETEVYGSSSDGNFTHYKQKFLVIDTLKGTPPGSDVKVARTQFTNSDPDTVLQDEDGIAMGILPPGEYILFLQSSASSNLYSIVGVSQGILYFDATSHVSSVPSTGFSSFVGMDLGEVQGVVNNFSGGN